MRAVAYIRVSTEEQAHEGVSLAVQEAKLRAYCLVRGLEVVELVADAGVSGGKPLEGRPGGGRVLELVRNRAVDGVVALKLDRLFRDATDCLTVADRWQKAKVSLHLVDLGGQAVDTSSATGRFFFMMIAAVAEMERNLIRERTKGAMKHLKEQGRRAGQIPYGYISENEGKLAVCESEAFAIARIQMLHREHVSIRNIAEILEFEGCSRRGKRWHPTTVARILARSDSPIQTPE